MRRGGVLYQNSHLFCKTAARRAAVLQLNPSVPGSPRNLFRGVVFGRVKSAFGDEIRFVGEIRFEIIERESARELNNQCGIIRRMLIASINTTKEHMNNNNKT